MKVVVCGGRNLKDYRKVCEALYSIDYHNQITLIIHGGASGADSLADEWAASHSRVRRVFKADWKKYGKSAGPIRNQKMLDEAKPDVVVAFPGGKGTADMVNRAKKIGIEVMEILA
jgi:predicted Rossmann-fold nucleotide-binding protein